MPFRELFVEVSEQLLIAAIAEANAATVRSAEVIHQAAPRGMGGRRWDTTVTAVGAFMRQIHGWQDVVALRSAHYDATELSGVAECGHAQKVVISDLAVIALRPKELLDIIDTAVATQRSCYCMVAA
jgi:hypothetical protein